MPFGRYIAAGLKVGLGFDIAAGPDLSIFNAMRLAFGSQNARRVTDLSLGPVVRPVDLLAMATLGGARELGIDCIVVDSSQ